MILLLASCRAVHLGNYTESKRRSGGPAWWGQVQGNSDSAILAEYIRIFSMTILMIFIKNFMNILQFFEYDYDLY